MDSGGFERALLELGHSQRSFAKWVGVHETTVARWLAPGGEVPLMAVRLVEMACVVRRLSDGASGKRR